MPGKGRGGHCCASSRFWKLGEQRGFNGTLNIRLVVGSNSDLKANAGQGIKEEDGFH